MSKPILAVDVDGVISLFDFEQPGPPADTRFELVDGLVHCISVPTGDQLRRLGRNFELVWATGWEARANEHLPAILGVPELPYLSFDGKARFGSSQWKLTPLEEYSRGRALAWIDDCLEDVCVRWAEGRPEPTLLVPTESHLGLEESHVETLEQWARSLH
jgi:hypothetical protein